MKNKIITLLIIVFSIICGIISKDYFLGTIILICGLLNAYYASEGKIYNYVFGGLYCLLSGYIHFINGLYGIAILSFLLYFPFQIHGFLSWNKKIDENNEVKVRGFTLKNSIIIITSCVLGSLLFGFLLSKIPTQRLAFLDSSSNMLNICGIILMNLRFKECWAVWIFNNTIDLSIWTINFINGTPNSTMMLLVSIGYEIINIYGLIKWWQKTKKVKKMV